MFIKWVTIKKLAELSGYTEDAIRAKKKKGMWLKDKHWRKARDNRVLFNVKEIEIWMES